MSIEAAPRPGSASWARRLGSHAVFETLTVLRHGEQALLNLILPGLFLVLLTTTTRISLPLAPGQDRVDLLAPGIIALAVISSAFTGPAIATGFDRRAGALRMLATTPLGPGGLLGGKALGVLGVQVVQILVLGSVAAGLGWRPEMVGLAPAILAVALGSAAFSALALLVAGTLRTEAVLAGANLLWVLMALGGGVVLPSGPWSRWLPSGALGDGLRAATQADLGAAWPALVLLAAWAGVFSLAALRWFRWH